MDKKLIIAPEIYDKIPGLIILSGIVDVTHPKDSQIKEYLKQNWENLHKEVQVSGYKTQPLIAQWREALLKAGIPVKDYPLSIEAIAKRAMNIPTPFSINPIVDAYNALSMELILPLGAYDFDKLAGNLQLRIAHKDEPFQALGNSSNESTLDSEIVYADDTDILTRQFLWRQADKAKITKETKRIIFVCELLDSMGEEIQTNAEEIIKKRFGELFGNEIQSFTVDKKTPKRS